MPLDFREWRRGRLGWRELASSWTEEEDDDEEVPVGGMAVGGCVAMMWCEARLHQKVRSRRRGGRVLVECRVVYDSW